MLEQSGSARVGIRLHEGEGHGSADVAAAVSGRRQVCGRGYGGEKGNLRLIARYVVLPGGQRINLPADLSKPVSPRALAFRRGSNSKRSQARG